MFQMYRIWVYLSPYISSHQAEMMCEHSLWSLPPSQLSCEATASNQTTSGRSGGRNLPVSFHNGRISNFSCNFSELFQADAKLDLGVRAGQKLREMARREEEEEVKTKVRPTIVFLFPHLFSFLLAKKWVQ